MIARSSAGLLTTVARTLSATSSREAAPAATVFRSWLGGPGGRLDSGTAQARVALDVYPELASGPDGRGGKARKERGVVGRDRDAGACEQVAEALELPLAEEVVRDQNVVDSGIGHHLGLAELLARDAPRAEVELAPGDLDDLVRLHVGPVDEPDLVAVALPALEVALEPAEVDDERRGRP